MKFLHDFKTFALKGNIVDLAIGVIIGAAFGNIVSSLVTNIIMPFLNILISDINLKNLKIILNDPLVHGEAITVNYGIFIQNIIDFLIISFTIFLFVKLIRYLRREALKEQENKDILSLSNQERTLIEIRDLLKENISQKQI